MKGAAWLLSTMIALGSGLTGKGCTGSRAGEVRTITEADFGRVINVEVGDRVRVSLSENPSTGFTWRCGWQPQGHLDLVRDRFVPGEPGRPGQGGVRNLVFCACASGRTELWVQSGRWRRGGERRPTRFFIIRAS
jgi:predicted secreted protein